MMYYMSKNTDNVFTEDQIKIVNAIYGEDEFEKCVEIGTFVEVDAPNVIDLINRKNMSTAAYRYRELHDCTLKEAYDAVHNIRRDIRLAKKHNKKDNVNSNE